MSVRFRPPAPNSFDDEASLFLVGAGLLAGAMNAMAGGSAGIGIGKELPPLVVRAVTITFAAAMTAIFFVRA